MNSINWHEIYTKTSPKLLGICRRYIKDIATAEDIVQDSFIVAIQKEETLKDKSALQGWLSRIVINMAIHHLKEVKKINFSTQQDYEIVDSTTVMNTIAIDAKSLLLSADLERDDILEAIDRLPEHHKSVFNMYVIDRFSHSEIGKILHISTGTSKSHLSRARKAIQLFLLERIKEKPVDEKKKRRIAFLIFLGFGNQMFANFCKKQFQDFEIEPLETFESVTNKGAFPSQFIGLAKINPVPKFMTIAICFLGVLGVAFYAYFFEVKDIPQKHPKPDLESVDIIPENQLPVAVEDTAKGEEPATEPKSIKTLFTQEKATVTNKNSQKTTEEVNSIVTKDSVKNEPQKVVIIKRQIVKKDTVYVSE